MTVTEGLHEMTADDYHADKVAEVPSLSAGIAKILCSATPLHAWTAHPRLNPDWEPIIDDKFDIGTAAHRIMLDGVDAIEVVDAKDWRTKEAKEQRDAARSVGKIPLLPKDADRVRAMTNAWVQLTDFQVNPPLLFQSDGKAEQTVVWDEGDGVVCRARIDWLHNDGSAVDDYKTAHDGNPEHWSRRALFNNGYDVQAAFYLRGLEKALGIRPVWRWVVQESRPPYAMAVVTPGADVLAVANAKVDFAINLWRGCLSTGVWPAWSTTPFEAELQPWAEESKWIVNAEGFVA